MDTPDSRLAEIARRQHGIVTAAQLAAVGLGRATVSERVRRGRLHRIHRGVYAVGHAAPSERQSFIAAVLVCGAGAVLSHGSAAVLWGFLKPLRGPIHVTSPNRSRKSLGAEIVLHRSPSLGKEDVTRRERIPVTTPGRTIRGLEGTIEPYLFRRAKRQAELMKFKLDLPTDRSRSDLESDFLAFLAKHGFPRPEVNAKVAGYRIDFLWRDQRVAVETDFFDYHRGSVAFEEDHERELHLRRAGYVVRRFTGAQIRNHPALVVADLGEVLSRG